MIGYIRQLLPALLFVLLAQFPHEHVLAQNNADIQAEQSASFVYGESLTFEAQATTAATLEGARLNVRVANQENLYTEIVSVFPGTTVFATHTMTVDSLQLPPFAEIIYFWDFQDQSGSQYHTTEQTLLYEDTNIPWKWERSSQGHITINTDGTDQIVATTALEIATNALAEQSQSLGIATQHDISVYIYPELTQLAASLRLHGQHVRDWVAAYAIPDQHIILIASMSGPEMLPNMQRDLPHEITHLVIYDRAGKATQNVPGWLSEGLALGSTSTPDPTFRNILDESVHKGVLLSLEVLCVSNFSGLPPHDTALAYAQSESLVRYITNRYGISQVQALLAAYADGLPCGGGVERALGISLSTLETQWHAELSRSITSTPIQEVSLTPWILVWAVSLVLALLFVAPQPHPAEEKSAYDTRAALSSVSEKSPDERQGKNGP